VRLTTSPGDSSAAKLNARGGLPELKPVGNPVWQTAIRLSGDSKGSEQLFDLMWLFGFAVYP